MGRLPRAIDDGLVYHALNRGNNRAAVFADDDDHLAFLEALAVAKDRYPFRLFGYGLMSNHILSRRTLTPFIPPHIQLPARSPCRPTIPLREGYGFKGGNLS